MAKLIITDMEPPSNSTGIDYPFSYFYEVYDHLEIPEVMKGKDAGKSTAKEVEHRIAEQTQRIAREYTKPTRTVMPAKTFAKRRT